MHRLQDGTRGPVYAFTDELAQWMKGPISAEPVISILGSADAKDVSVSGSLPLAGAGTQFSESPGPRLLRRASDRVPPPRARRGWLVGTLVLAVTLALIGGFAYYKLIESRSARAADKLPEPGGRTTSPEAQDFYLKGRYEWNKRTPEGLNKAVDYFTQAIVRDPNYAQAYVGLADCYNLLREYSAMPPEEAYPRALAAARKAVELDGSSADAHTSLAFASFYGTFNVPDAEREFQNALALNPNDARAHHWYATFLYAVGRYREALYQIEIAQQLDPASTSILADKGLILLYVGPREKGVALLKQLESTAPEFPSTYRYLQDAYLMNQDYPAYLEAWGKAARLLHDERELAIVKAAEKGFASGGRQVMLESILGEQKKAYAEGHLSAYALAETYSFLGDRLEALRYLRNANEQRETALVGIRNDPAFKTLHGEPDFRNLVVQIGLPPLQ